MSYLQPLIRIYAANTVEDVKNRPELLEQPFGMSLAALSEVPGFSAEQNLVRDQKLTIEADADRYDTADKALQISECLKALLRLAVYDDSAATTVALKIETQRALLTKMYGQGWKVPQREHFDFVADLLKAWYAYFLSYTNPGAHVVNDDYEEIIAKHADPVTRKSRDPDTDNMLADALVTWLDRNKVGRRSFYDKKRLEAGDLLRESIVPAVRNGLAFVQLVHLDTFTAKKDVNWAFEEYKVFKEYNEEVVKARADYSTAFESRLIPLIAGDPVQLKQKLSNDKLNHKDHRPWRDHVFAEGLYLQLPISKTQFEDVMQKLESAIMRRAYRIIESVPA